jgi:hypothetical protein
MTKLGFEKQALEWFMKAITTPSGWCWSRAPRARARPRRSTPRSPSSTRSRRTSAPPKTPSSTTSQGINQVQMHDDIGLNFAAALRSFLRQDPDIIMVGEIRDFETAEIGVKAALTGHMVLSTLHTNDAPAPSRASSTWASSPSWSRRHQPRARPAPRRRDLRRLQAGDQGRRPQALREIGFKEEEIAQANGAALEGRPGCGELQRHGLQGPRRALRGHARCGTS